MSKFATLRRKAKENKAESTPANSDAMEAAKSVYKKATQTVDAAKLAITWEGAKGLQTLQKSSIR